MKYHHIPTSIIDIISLIYLDFHTSITTNEFNTPYIPVRKGVLQGDCVSPLLFNLVINTFIQYIKKDHFEQLGYKYFKFLIPKHWMQFADDAVAITGEEYEIHILLNAFGRWCSWANMIIRVDKCHSFGMKKVLTTSKQIKPKLYINNSLIPSIEINEAFVYLGRHFDFSMSDLHHKENILDKTKTFINTINNLPLHPKNKLKIYHRYVLSKISWDMTVSDISQTWYKNNVDNFIMSQVRSWFEIPISCTMEIFTLSRSKYGVNLIKPSARAFQLKTNFRKVLSQSKNEDIKQLHEITRDQCNIQYDQYKSSRDAIKAIKLRSEEHVINLTTQGLVVKAIWNLSWKKANNFWHKALDILPRNIYSFVLRYLNNTLANGSNTIKWRTSETSLCRHCGENETLGHVVNGCKIFLNEGRYTWRHDSILKTIANSLSSILGHQKIHCDCDLNTFKSPCIITGNEFRPDLVIEISCRCVIILELTVGFETNLEKNYFRKKEKYKLLIETLKEKYSSITYLNLSMGSIGTIFKESNNIEKVFKEIGMEEKNYVYLIKKIIEICIRCSYYIFCRRAKEWENPESLTW